jgi:hypothetical protein
MTFPFALQNVGVAAVVAVAQFADLAQAAPVLFCQPFASPFPADAMGPSTPSEAVIAAFNACHSSSNCPSIRSPSSFSR